MRRLVNSRNGHNSCVLLNIKLYKTEVYENSTEIGTKSSQYGLYETGNTHVTKIIDKEKQVCEYERILKINYSSDCSLKLENMK